tara:strand:- start:2503 stop:5595 length:3093 start_codon:yes stop_codon:yes gene_type:complete
MSETIIIESNRQIAYKQERASLVNVNERNANVVLPNNKWRTRLENGVKVDVGDTIQVEAVMVNVRGSPDETIEFSGVQTVQEATDTVDNKVLVRFQKYITNRQQFNCNLPLFGASVQKLNPQGGNYGYLSFSDFDSFKQNFPYRGIEGMYLDGASTYAEVTGGGVFSKPPSPLDDANPTRMFLGTDDFIGYANILNSADRGAWNFQTTDVELEVATGFNTPSKVGESLTAQLHQRQGIPNNWEEKDVKATVVRLTGTDGSGSFVVSPNACITDQSYQTVPTATGDIFRARAEGKWHAGIAGEVAFSSEGTGYTEEEGRDVFHRNLLCGNPYEYRQVYAWLVGRITAKSSATISLADVDTTGLYTGHLNIDAADVGHYGLNTVLLDDFEHYTVAGDNFVYANHIDTGADLSIFRETGVTTDMDYLKITNENTLWVTNNVYNRTNVNYFTTAWLENEIPVNNADPSKNATPLTTDLTKEFYQSIYYGRADDAFSCGACEAKVNLATTPHKLTPPTLSLNSYQLVGTDTCLIRRFGESSWNSRNELEFWSRYDPRFEQRSINKVNFSFPLNTKFTLTDSTGKFYPQSISEEAGIAIIPVFYKQTEFQGSGGTIPVSLRDIPFCAFVSIYSQDPENNINDRLPCPMAGEFFGRSPSTYDNLLAKVITTQKTYTVSTTVASKTVDTYPTGDTEIATRTYQYMPYCMIGADNPTIGFDDTYGRFTISGLHTSVRGGNGVFQEITDEANTQATTESMCSFSQESAISGINVQGIKVPYNLIIQNVNINSTISSQSGLTIQDIFLYTKGGTPLFDQPLDPRTPVAYEGSLFSKLGFRLEQLIPYVGQRQSNFNRGSYNLYLGSDQSFVNKYNTMVAPLTTNAYISAADQLSMVTNARDYIMSNLGGNSPNQEIFINAQSDDLVAVDLPSKLDYSYLIIYSNIVQNTQFYGGASGQQKVPAMAYVSRNYSTGDFFFSGGPTSWEYVVDKEYVITEFDVNITLPNGLPAPIENNSSIIYKITKAKTLPPPLSAFEPQKKK